MADKSFGTVFIDELGDMYDSEKRLIHAMPKLIAKSHSEGLKDELRKHADQCRVHMERLERAFELMGEQPRRKHCKAMEGLLAESNDLLSESSQEAVRDTAILAAVQKIEHYEIATYTTLREWAQQLGKPEVSSLLQQTLDEETAGDELLSQLALTLNNDAARTE